MHEAVRAARQIEQKIQSGRQFKIQSFCCSKCHKKGICSNRTCKALVFRCHLLCIHRMIFISGLHLDLFGRKIVCWSLSDGLSIKQTTVNAWKMAVKNRTIADGLIFHSGTGIQYANKNLRMHRNIIKIIQEHEPQRRPELDNAVAESFFKSLITAFFLRQ
jgi:transposase InsO family protein